MGLKKDRWLHASQRLVKHIDCVYSCICQGRLDESYRIEKQVGWGSFGTVYLARHKDLGYKRAVKQILKNPDDPQHVNLLMNEVHALMDLDHPNVVKLVRYYDEGPHLYLVFEFCSGPDLFSRISDAMQSTAGRMSEDEAVMALYQMLKALNCCHCHYMGHFDVKPENFMYSSEDLSTLKMIDLGLSGRFKRDIHEIRGTAEYMAPEVWDGLYGPEADIWSCGVVLFLMLTGHTLLPSQASEAELRYYARDRAWIRQRLRWAGQQGISPSAHSLLAAMLRHDRHQRPTVREAMCHPFVASCRMQAHHAEETAQEAGRLMRELPEVCRNFTSEPMLKRAAMLLVAHVGTSVTAEAEPQRLAFSIMDQHSDGELSIEAMEDHYVLADGSIPEQLDEALSGVDINGDGYITYLEFLSATLSPSMRNNEGLWRLVFSLLDRGRDGYVDAADLAAAFCHGKDRDGVCRDALAEVTDKSRLSWEDFRELMLSESGRRG